MKGTRGFIILAAIFWFLLFSPYTKNLFNFWWAMVTFAGILAVGSMLSDRSIFEYAFHFKPKFILIGLVSAVLLYAVFFVGDKVTSFIFDFAKPQVQAVYATKSQASPTTIALLLVFWIGPAEEVFWRGYVQRRMERNMTLQRAWLLSSTIYALVHFWAFNNMLLLAALICGMFWGAMFAQYRSLLPGIISHAVWDVLIFVVLPIK